MEAIGYVVSEQCGVSGRRGGRTRRGKTTNGVRRDAPSMLAVLVTSASGIARQPRISGRLVSVKVA